MPTEACYVVSIENAILLSTTYGILSVYFEDVMSFGFLFFAVFIGLCLCYVCILFAFGLVLFDDNTNKQIILLESKHVDNGRAPTPNQIPLFARLLTRSGAICCVALFVLFVTVGCEFLTDDAVPEADNLSTIALKKIDTETQLTTQFAVSTGFAIFFMIVLMLLCNNQQLNGILVRLQMMTDDRTASTEQSRTSTGEDIALFVRTLLILYMIVCDSTGTFKPLPYKALPSFLLNLIPNFKDSVLNLRNYISILFLAWCLFVDIARALMPKFTILLILVELLIVPQIFGNILTLEVLWEDVTLTNFACLVLVICDALCVVYASLIRIYHIIKNRKWSSKKRSTSSIVQAAVVPQGQGVFLDMSAFHDNRTVMNTSELNFNETDINVNNINLRIFEKKIN